MLIKGDKIILKEKMGLFDNIGEICEVVDVSEDGTISFKFGNWHLGCMSYTEYEKYFEKYEDTEGVTVSEKYINNLLNQSEIIVDTVYNKCTIVSIKLPNGFVIVESSACVDPKNYDKEIGVNICMERIKNKLWELEGYKVQDNVTNYTIEELLEMGEKYNDVELAKPIGEGD